MALLWLASSTAAGDAMAEEVRTKAGLVEGTAEPDGSVRVFLGIPFAAPPVGDLRWREPRPAARPDALRARYEALDTVLAGPRLEPPICTSLDDR